MLEQEPLRIPTAEEQYRDALVEFELALQEYHPFKLINGFMRVQAKGFSVFNFNKEDYTIYYSKLLELSRKGYKRAKILDDVETTKRFLQWRNAYSGALGKLDHLFSQSTPQVIVSKT